MPSSRFLPSFLILSLFVKCDPTAWKQQIEEEKEQQQQQKRLRLVRACECLQRVSDIFFKYHTRREGYSEKVKGLIFFLFCLKRDCFEKKNCKILKGGQPREKGRSYEITSLETVEIILRKK